MKPSLGLRSAVLLLLVASAPFAAATELGMSRTQWGHLSALRPDQALRIDAFPIGAAHAATIRLTRVQIYSADAQLYVVTGAGTQKVARSKRIFLRGYTDDGSAKVAMSLNPDGSFVEGNGSGPEGSFVLHTRVDASGNAKVSAQALESTLPAGFKFDFRCGNDSEPMNVLSLDQLATQLHIATNPEATAQSQALRLATVAVDTDSPFMSKLFSNNTTNAADWIASMFNTMNTMYERDLLVRLNQGTTIFRTNAGTDPYTGATSVPANTADLDIFASYWKANESGVSRTFAILLSGQEASTANSCGASGIAWVDQYCQKGTTQGSDTVGSYSLSQVCSNINIDPDASFDARIVGHEIGHNFGAFHTHCTDITSGQAKVSTNTIDQCYNLETSCWSGANTCPSSGVGAPAGTIMSYCNVILGCGSDHQNVLNFHPTQITKVLTPAISASPAGCLSAVDDIFYNGFE